MKISDILLESFSDAKRIFTQDEDKQTVSKYLDTFKDLAKRNIIKGQEKDISYWIKQGWESFKQLVDDNKEVQSNSESKKSKKKDSIVVYEDEEKMVVIPLSTEASCYYGKNTKWCTSATKSTNYFNEYFYDKGAVMFYVLLKSGLKYAAAYIHHSPIRETFEYFDEEDNKISGDVFFSETSFSPDSLRNFYNMHLEAIDRSKEAIMIPRIKKDPHLISNLKNPSEAAQMAAITSNPKSVMHIAKPTLKVQKAVVAIDPSYVSYISDVAEEVQLSLIAENPSIIGDIRAPSEAVQLAVVKQNGKLIGRIYNPTERVQEIAVMNDPSAIEFIDNPTERAQEIAVTNDRSAIKLIRKPTVRVQALAGIRNDNTKKYIDNLDEDELVDIVKSKPFLITLIPNPSEAVAITALKNIPPKMVGSIYPHIMHISAKVKNVYADILASHKE